MIAGHWLEERRKFPSWMIVGVEEPLVEGSQVDVTILPSIDRRDLMGCASDPRYTKGYEVPFCLAKGLLTRNEAARLRTALSVISRFHGLGIHESFAFLVHFFLLIVDSHRSSHGQESLLRGPTLGDADVRTEKARQQAVDQMNRPLFGIEALLGFWDISGGTIADAHIYKSPDGSPGRPSYFHIPPIWLAPDKVKELAHLESAPSKVPVFVESSLASLIEQFARFYEEHERVPGAPTINFLASPESNVAGASLETPSPVRLSEAQEDEFQQNGFKSRLVIEVTGQTAARRGNVVLLDGYKVILPDSLFKLFLRLAAAAFEKDDGFISREQLRPGEGPDGEMTIAPEGLDQAIHRLRLRLAPGLSGLEAKDFIEFQRGRVRLSTHQAYIDVRRERLLKHPDEAVRNLVHQLPTRQSSG